MSGPANGQVLDHYLHPQFEVIRLVHDNLEAIRAVASRLTPVEDLADFQEQIAALHAKLGLLTEASETIINATPAGIAMLTAVNAAAQRLLLELKSAALYEASHFALASDWAAVELELASLDGRINGVVSSVNQVIATANIDRNNADATVQRVTVLETELTNLETGQSANTTAIDTLTSTTSIQGSQITSQGQALTALTSRLDGVEGSGNATALAVDSLTTTVTQHGIQLSTVTNDVTQLASRITDAETGLVSNASALSDLSTEVTQLGDNLTVASEDIVALRAEIGSPGNLAPNAGFEADTHGWSIFSRGMGWAVAALGRNEDASTMLPLSMDALSVAVVNQPTGKLGIRSVNLPVRGTQRYMLSGYLAGINCATTLEWRLLDQYGQLIQMDVVGQGRTGGATDINTWPRIWGAIPANADARELQIQVWADGTAVDAPWISTLSTAGAGGTLVAGTYYYRVTALTSVRESALSNEASVVTAGATSANTLTWAAVPGALGYRVYRGTATGIQDGYFEVGAVTSFTDTGAALVPGAYVEGPVKLWLLRPMLEEVSGLQDGPSPWVPGVSGLAKNTAEAVSVLTARIEGVEGDLTATAGELTTLTSEIGTVRSALVNEIITSANKDASFSASINNLSSRMVTAEGDISATSDAVSGLTTRVTSAEGTITSQSQQLTNLQAQVNAIDADTGGSGQAISDLNVRVTAAEDTIDSHSQQITSLQNSVTSANKIFVQNTAPPTAGRTINDLWIHTGEGNKPYYFDGTNWVARLDGNKNTIFVQNTAPTAKAVNDLWIHTGDNNKPYRWTGTAWADISDARTTANASAISTLDSRVTSVEGVNTSQGSAITTLQNTVNNPTTGVTATASAVNSLTTRVSDAENVNSAQASSLQSLTTTVNGHTSTISTHASSINGLKAEWNLTLNVNGYVSGVQSQNNGSYASFGVLADKFKVVNPAGTAGLTWENGTLWNKGSAHSILLGQNFGTTADLLLYVGPNPASAAAAAKTSAVFWVDNTGAATFSGLVKAGRLEASVISLDSARLHTNGDRLAPFVIKDAKYIMGARSSYTLMLDGFVGPSYGTGYNFKRFARQKMDVWLDVIVSGNADVESAGMETGILEVQYDGGVWSQIASVTTNVNNRSAFPITVRYTTSDTAWGTCAFRVRTINGRTEGIRFMLDVINFNESGNAGGTNSGTVGGGGFAPPPDLDPWCVDYETTVLPDGTWVRDLQLGEFVACWNDDALAPAIALRHVKAIGFGEEDCFELVAANGARIIQSRSTPMTLRDGRIVTTEHMLGEDVLALTNGELSWIPVIQVTFMGRRRVVKLNAENSMFFAGMDSSLTFATHNADAKP